MGVINVATGTFSNNTMTGAATPAATFDLAKWCWYAFRAMGSLKITVTMFALGTLILFVGTLAQDEETIVDVKKAYFNSWVATVPFDVFQPQTIWPHKDALPYAFAIPGGASIGLILLVNLIAAKLTRFKMNAKGGRFVAGVVCTIIGFALVALIVAVAPPRVVLTTLVCPTPEVESVAAVGIVIAPKVTLAVVAPRPPPLAVMVMGLETVTSEV